MEQKSVQKSPLRLVAAILYAVYFFYELILQKGIVTYYNVTSLPTTTGVDILLAFGAAAFAVWLFSSSATLSASLRRATAAATLLIMLYNIVVMNTTRELFAVSLTEIIPDYAQDTLMQTIAFVIRLALLAIAAIFVLFSDGVSGGLEKPVKEIGIIEEPVVEVVETEVEEVTEETENEGIEEEK